jgi:O-methyltransferase domain
MNAASDQVMDLIFGRWRSQILSAGAELGAITSKIAARKRRRRSPPSWAPPEPALSLAQGASRHGGYGHLMCALLLANPGLRGIVLGLLEVVEDAHELWARKRGLQQRCKYVAGNMFEVPEADAYSLKMILHDSSDAECIKILSNIRKAAAGPTRVFIVEYIVPEHNVPHFSKLFDIHMMCWGTDQERTEAEYVRLLERAGWKPSGSLYPANRQMGIITGVNA